MEERLDRLRGLLVEFYEGTGPKAELNEELGSLRSQSWREALYWIESSRDFGGCDSSALYMSYFCASALEEALRVDFRGEESTSARSAIRLALFAPQEGRGALVACATGSRPAPPGAVRTRLCKVFVDVGKAGWPHELPSFLEEICAAAMAQDASTSALGLELLSLAAEEFLCGSPRGTTARRRRELKNLFSSHLPQLVALLGQALVRRASVPPPSQGGASSPATLAESYGLSCLQTVVSNAPLQHQHLRPELFETLFHLVERDMSSPSASKATAIGALGALDSVLAKRLVPPDMANFVQQLGGHVLKMLRSLTDLLDAQPADAVDDQEAQDFLAQVCELVATFVEQHLPRVVDPTELLTLLAKLTFSRAVNDAGSLRRTLRPWATLVDFAEDAPPAVAAATGEGLASVLCSLLETRLLFSSNSRALELLDEEEDDDDTATAFSGEKKKMDAEEGDDLVDLDELVDEMAGGEPDPRALGGGRGMVNTNELSALLSEAVDLFAAASRGVYGPHCSSRLAASSTSRLETALNNAFSPSSSGGGDESNRRRAATDAATLLYALSASAPYGGGSDDAHAAGRAAVATALGVLGQRAHGRAFVNLAVASLDALRDLTPAIAYRGEGDEVVEKSLDAASMSLDVSVSPYPEPVQRAGAWLVLAVAKSSADKNETSLRKLSSLAASGAWVATANAPPRCRSLVYRAAAAVSLAMAARQNRDAFDAINALVQPLAEPLHAAARRVSMVDNNLVGQEDVLDVGALDTCQRASRSLAALCAGFARDGAARGAVGRAFFGTDNNNATSVALAAAPALLAYCAARALRSVDGSSQPRVVRTISSARLPHLACATGAVDLLIAASRAFGKEKAGGRALEGVSALLAAFEVAPPAVAFDQVRRGGAVLGSRPPRAAALHLVKAACRLVTVVTADNDAKKAVPDACSLAAHHVAPLAADPNVAPDLFPILLEVCRRLLVDQWAAFVVSSNDGGRAATTTKRFRDDRAAANFDSLLDLVLAGCRGVELTSFCVRRSLLVLKDSNDSHRLYDFPPFALKWRAPLAHALFDTLLERRHDSIADDLILTLQDLAKPNHHQLFSHFLPNKLATINLTDQQRNYVLANLLGDNNDASSFPTQLQDAIADLHYFQALNT